MSRRRTGYTAVIEKAFPGLPPDAIQMLRDFANEHTYPPNTVLCKEGDTAESFYVITEGRVIVTRDMEGDDDFVMGFLGPGQYFGEMALLSQDTRAATVTSIMETKCLEITKEHFEEVFNSSQDMARSILKTLINIVRETDKRAIADLEERNTELAKAYADLESAQSDRIAKAALEAQMEVAGKAQRSLMPRDLPEVPGYHFSAQFEPARHIGGDFYGVRFLPDGRVSVVLADVSDKGAHAALFMAVARTLFLTEEQHHKKPVDIVGAVHNGLIQASSYDMFVTAVYGVLDPTTGIFRYVRAGHDEPLWVKKDGSAQFLGGRGRFLGLWPDVEPSFEEQSIQLEEGDCLIIYSDGVTDMRNPQGESYGRERMCSLVKNLRVYDADRIARSIYNAVHEHRDTAEAFDDFTLLVLRAE
jgi:phosphoserine phosphatase RsbU/P